MLSSSSTTTADIREADPASLETLSRLCDDAAINSSLLARSNAHHADNLLATQQRLVSFSRILAGLAFLSGAGAGVLGYYQYAKLYRVWRLRNPRTVQRYFQGTVGCVAFSVTSLLFLFSPVGFLAKHTHNAAQACEFDALAFESLVLQQRYATLHAVCGLHVAAAEERRAQAWWRRWLSMWVSPAAPKHGAVAALQSASIPLVAREGKDAASVTTKHDLHAVGTGSLALRRALLSIDDAAFPYVVFTNTSKGSDAGETDSRDSHVPTGGEPQQARPHATSSSTRAPSTEERQAELAAELLLPSDEKSKDSSLPTGKKTSESARVSGGVTMLVTAKSKPAELWHAYDLLNESWKQIVEEQNRLAGETI